MELFKETNIDFLGKKALTLGLSALLIAATFISLAAKGGPKLGIDFRGGTLMYVKFAGTPPVQQIRNALQSRISGEVTVQELEAGSREIIIGTELKSDRELEAARQQIQRTLSDTLGNLGGKADLNNIGAADLAGRLRSAGLAEEQTQKVAADILAYRDRTKGGVLSSLNDVSSVPGVTPQVVSALQREAGVAPFTIRQVEIVGPKAGKDLQRQAIYATLGALAGMLVYIAFRFEFIAGVAAVLAIIHDTVITLGFFSFFDREINLNVIAALLTLIGYSMNDKIVVFDRVRENIKLMRREPFYSLVNRSINQTLSRTMLTAGPTLLTTLALYFLGGPVLEGIAFALFIGILVGTYSSIFIASAILVWWHQYSERRKLATSGPGSARDAVRPATTVKTAK